jgi:hypothetical protein
MNKRGIITMVNKHNELEYIKNLLLQVTDSNKNNRLKPCDKHPQVRADNCHLNKVAN